MKSPSKNLTALLKDAAKGNNSALKEVWPVVYDEIHRLATRYLQEKTPGDTLQPTSLVNEAFLRMAEGKQIEWQNREQFFAIAATVMRRVVIDHAKTRQAEKRDGGSAQVTFDEKLHWADADSDNLIQLDRAIAQLESIDKRLAKVVELRYFGGMNDEEIAIVLGTSVATVKRDWAMAKLWLYRDLTK